LTHPTRIDRSSPDRQVPQIGKQARKVIAGRDYIRDQIPGTRSRTPLPKGLCRGPRHRATKLPYGTSACRSRICLACQIDHFAHSRMLAVDRFNPLLKWRDLFADSEEEIVNAQVAEKFESFAHIVSKVRITAFGPQIVLESLE